MEPLVGGSEDFNSVRSVDFWGDISEMNSDISGACNRLGEVDEVGGSNTVGDAGNSEDSDRSNSLDFFATSMDGLVCPADSYSVKG